MSEPEITTARSYCPLDCPDACTLEVEVAGDRVVKVEGDRRNPYTQGFICAKVRRLPAHLYGPERLLHPAVRDGRKGEGRFRRVSWDEALERVVCEIERVRERFGGEAILPFFYGGSNGYLSQGTTDARLFHRLGASNLERTVCAATSARAHGGLYGRMPGVALSDYVHSRLIVVWGANPSVSHIHLVPIIQEAKRRGARLVVVDPRRTGLAHQADLHLAVRPGSDLPVALAVIRWLFEHGAADLDFLAAHATGVEELRRRAEPWTIERAAEAAGVATADLERLASWWAESSPAVVRCGWGVERNRNGGSATAAVLALPAVGGKLGRRGGGFTMSNSGIWRLDPSAAAGEPPPPTRHLNMNRLGEDLLHLDSPPVALLFVYDANPLTTLPAQEKVRAGLAREDLFTVVFDQVMTDTARWADLLLPAAAFLERPEMSRGYGSMVLLDAPALVPAAGEARANHEVFAELCRRLGLTRPGEPESAAEIKAAILASGGGGADLSAALAHDGVAFPREGAAPVQMVDVFPRTAGGKIHLVPEALDREAPHGLYHFTPDPATARHPLALISPATNRTVSSMLGQLYRGQVALEMAPADAAARGIAGGDSVRVFNELGEVRCRAKVSDELPPGTVFLPKGLWSHNTLSGTTSNALVPDTLSDLAAGACFNDARVEVERLAET